jgi:SAM-dependent methyltransferase
MDKPLDESELKELEQQLFCPKGPLGIEVGKQLHENNINMTLASIEAMKLSDNDCVLEIGHGNCSHLSMVLDKAQNISYKGLEISELMKTEAETIHTALATKHTIDFDLYDGITLPYRAAIFDKVFTVNTLYFWLEPLEFLNQIYNRLKPKGCCIITFALKDFMKTLPFVGDYFKLYNDTDIKNLVKTSKFDDVHISIHEELVMSKVNEPVKRTYAIATLYKL